MPTGQGKTPTFGVSLLRKKNLDSHNVSDKQDNPAISLSFWASSEDFFVVVSLRPASLVDVDGV
jgi:hypothetical protein